MPWRDRRRRKKQAEQWRRENQRRLNEERTGPVAPGRPGADDEPGDEGDGGGEPGPTEPPADRRPERASAASARRSSATDEPGDGSASARPARSARQRPDVPVSLGAVSTAEYERTIRRVVSRALAEDLGHRGDLTSMATVPVHAVGRAVLVARAPGVVAGLAAVEEVVRQVDQRITVELTVADGAEVLRGDVLARLEGPLRTLLTAERTLLNLVCQLSGVATMTAAFVAAVEGYDCVVRDTRKTTPGLRLIEKHAVAAGGGSNHRVGLYDSLLVKDNHVVAAGGVGAATRAALAAAPDGVHVQVEVRSLEEVDEALDAGAQDLLLDNFTPEEVRTAVVAIAGHAAVEASGGITLETAEAYADAGADRLAVGALTHSAPALDLALDVREVIGVDTARAAVDSAPVAEPSAADADEDPEPAVTAGVATGGDTSPPVEAATGQGRNGPPARRSSRSGRLTPPSTAPPSRPPPVPSGGGEQTGDDGSVTVERAPYDDRPGGGSDEDETLEFVVDRAPYDDRPDEGTSDDGDRSPGGWD